LIALTRESGKVFASLPPDKEGSGGIVIRARGRRIIQAVRIY
jgi:hypothetical protein